MLSHLEEVYIAADRNLVDVRFPVQYVIRPQTREHQDHRSYAGTVASGIMRPGDEVVVLPTGKPSRIIAIEGPEWRSGRSISADGSLGEPCRRHRHLPRRHDRTARQRAEGGPSEFDATVCWMADAAALEPGREYLIKHTTRTTRVEDHRAGLPA